MEPQGDAVPEAGAYRLLWEVLPELQLAERTLAGIEQRAPDSQRAQHLVHLRAAIAALTRVVPSTPPPT